MSLLGFLALLVALYVGSALWAWICIGVAAVGIVSSSSTCFSTEDDEAYTSCLTGPAPPCGVFQSL
ncbi:hypothetical protein [Corynebacterium sp. CNJ-954]|uniref:hypothetical protein n=1 Tax=Corynebacterium sp. CNJ-954 TaxID=1904962 RepID=UPI001651110A|nr:hypothetical protein [Corynebacterium sp. CNJ-954]